MQDSYFTEIQTAFAQRRGKNLLLSPTDWTLVESWQKREIPLHIVINGINNVFDNRKENQRPVASVSYCEHEVEALYKEFLDSQVGKSETSKATEPEEDYTTKTAAQLRQRTLDLLQLYNAAPGKLKDAISVVTTGMAAVINEFEETKDPQSLEEKLTAFEKQLNDAILESIPTTEGVRLLLEADKELSPYRSQIGEGYHQQLRELHLKRVREHFKVPRLSLFYL